MNRRAKEVSRWLKGKRRKVVGVLVLVVVVGGLGGTDQHHSLAYRHLSTTQQLISLMACHRVEGAPCRAQLASQLAARCGYCCAPAIVHDVRQPRPTPSPPPRLGVCES